MHFSTIILSLLPLFAVNAQTNDNSTSDTFFEEYLTFLNDSGYTSLSGALSQANQSESGQQWISKLSEGNWTVFTPTNEAVSSVSGDVSGNSTLLAQHLSYHYVYGNLRNTTSRNSTGGAGGGQTSASCAQSTSTGAPSASASAYGLTKHLWCVPPSAANGPQLLSAVFPNVTIGRTLLNASDLVQLEGNKSQVLAWSRSCEACNVSVLNQIQNVTVTNTTQWRNLFIAQVDGFLTPPGSVSVALTAVNDTPLLSFASQIQVPLEDGSNGSAVEALQQARGFTLFAPSADAFTSDVNNTIQQLQNNQTAALSVLQNYYVNGSTIYSPTLMRLAARASSGSSNRPIFSAAGEPFTLSFNETGLFVSNGNGSAAQVTRPDVLVENGVIHLIDRVLVNTAAETSAASSAFASATSVATVTSTDTVVIGIFPIPAPTRTGSRSGGGSSMTSSASGSQSSALSSSTESSSTSTSGTSETSSAQATASAFGIGRAIHF